MSRVTIFTPQLTKVKLPLVSHSVPAGFPSPAEEYLGDKLDLNERIIKNPASTFFARIEGDSMIKAGIMPDDIVVVDRSLEPLNNHIVIAVVNGEMTIKRLSTRLGIKLLPENDQYKPISVTGAMELNIWGVVTWRVGQVV